MATVPCCPQSCHGSVHICFGFCSKLHLILSFVCCPIVFTCSVLLLDKFAFFFPLVCFLSLLVVTVCYALLSLYPSLAFCALKHCFQFCIFLRSKHLTHLRSFFTHCTYNLSHFLVVMSRKIGKKSPSSA